MRNGESLKIIEFKPNKINDTISKLELTNYNNGQTEVIILNTNVSSKTNNISTNYLNKEEIHSKKTKFKEDNINFERSNSCHGGLEPNKYSNINNNKNNLNVKQLRKSEKEDELFTVTIKGKMKRRTNEYDKFNLNNNVLTSNIPSTNKSDLNFISNYTVKSRENIDRIEIVNNNISKVKFDSENKKICKICFETEDKLNFLIIPCLCQGSIKYIHESCLRKWIEKQIDVNNNPQCELCKYKYKFEYVFTYQFSNKKFCESMKSIFLVLLIVSIILLFIFSIVFIIVSSVNNLNDQKKYNLAVLLIIIFCSIDLVIVLFFCICLRRLFFQKIISDWKIKNFSSNTDSVDISRSYSNLMKSSSSILE